jgi:hypothetical protein
MAHPVLKSAANPICRWLNNSLPIAVEGLSAYNCAHAGIAQLVVRLTCNQEVVSSILTAGTNKKAPARKQALSFFLLVHYPYIIFHLSGFTFSSRR